MTWSREGLRQEEEDRMERVHVDGEEFAEIDTGILGLGTL